LSLVGHQSAVKELKAATNRHTPHNPQDLIDDLVDGVLDNSACPGRFELRNTPSFIEVKTNKPGPLPGGRHVFLGGDGKQLGTAKAPG
jgi:hypothetical protein